MRPGRTNRRSPFEWCVKGRTLRGWFRSNPALAGKIARVLKDLHREFGLKSRLAAPLVGRYLRFTMVREDRRLRQGWTYEPPTFCETNQMVAARSVG